MITHPLPQEIPFTDTEQEDSTHVFICTRCGARRYTNAQLPDALQKIEKAIEHDNIPFDAVLPRHINCNAIMTMQVLGQESDTPNKQPPAAKHRYAPIPYRQPYGAPCYWKNEESGVLRDALLAFLDSTIGREPGATTEQLDITQWYFTHYINAPLWQHPDINYEGATKLAHLKEQIKTANTVEKLKQWIDACLDSGLDPL